MRIDTVGDITFYGASNIVFDRSTGRSLRQDGGTILQDANALFLLRNGWN